MLKMCDVCEGKGTIGEEVCAQCNETGNVHVRGKKRTGRIVSYGEDGIRWDVIQKSDIIDLSGINIDNFSGFEYHIDMKKHLLNEIVSVIFAQQKADVDHDAMFISYKLYSGLVDYNTTMFSTFIGEKKLGAFVLPTIYGRYVFFHNKEDGLVLFVNIKKEGLYEE